MAEWTHEEWIAALMRRFGDNPRDWAFRCPSCGDTATGEDFRQALQDHPRERQGVKVTASDLLGQECIGRTLGALEGERGSWKGRGCDWCAYGLIPAPDTVVMPDGRKTSVFAMADAVSSDG